MTLKLQSILVLIAIASIVRLLHAAEQTAGQPGQWTIAQLRQAVTQSGKTSHRSRELMRRLAGVELTERLTPESFQKLSAAMPSPEAAEDIEYLADTSAFLDPPADELPALPRPDIAAQKSIVAQAVHYVARTLPSLPNLLAIRVTRQLVSASVDPKSGQSGFIAGFTLTNVSRESIVFNHGKETESPLPATPAVVSGKKSKHPLIENVSTMPATPGGLASHGEFGPMLAVILLDAAKGKLHWARWEQSGGKPVAVFQFAVDRSSSHFTVGSRQGSVLEFAGQPPKTAPGTEPAGSLLDEVPDLLQGEVLSASDAPVAYHGQLAIDPADGAILRIAVEAEPRPEDEIQLAKIMVEYAPVRLGSTFYICPMHSVAISRSMTQNDSTQVIPFTGPIRFRLNDVKFTDYRRFGSESNLIVP